MKKQKAGNQGAELAVLENILDETEGVQLRTEQSKSGTVEEDSFQSFAISIIDLNSGAIPAGDIDITGITATLEKSTGGGAFSVAGITQPTFGKAVGGGRVGVDYRFLAAEWITGDVYKLTVSGIEAEVNGDTVYIKDMVWSNIILESADILDLLDGTTPTPDAYRREYGVKQIQVITINPAANSGLAIIGEIFVNPCLIKSIVLHADSAQTGDLTSAAVEGGASQVIEFISAAVAIQANLDAENKQVAWTGAVYFPVGGQITVDFQGTGATPVDLKASIEYEAMADGGYLV